MTKYFSFCFLLTFTLFFSCHDDDGNAPYNNGQNYNPTEFAQNFGNAINRTFLGTVIDKNHNPIPDVSITIGNAMAQTDANGVFIISDAPVYERFGYVKAKKTGYITGSRSVVPSEGTNKVEIMLLEETVIATVNSGSVENVILPNGAAVELQGNYSKEDGTTYTGSVSVILHHLDPTDEDMQLQMPGMLYAANSENQERLLQTFGMLAVELKGSSGETLNLAEGSTAQITVPLDASLLSDAPSTIPLWHFDEEHGYWVEDGEASLLGNAYVGTVSHFSYWNCDIQTETVMLCINVTDENNLPLSNLSIRIYSNDSIGTVHANLDENGQGCGPVPLNETLELNIFNYNLCGNSSIYTSLIGSFSSDTSIDIIVPNNPDLLTETVTGTFNNCNDSSVTEGYVNLNYGGQTFSNYVTDGNFEINLLRCTNNNNFGLEAYDIVNLQATDSLSYTFTTPLTNIGTLTACNSIDEFIQYSVDDGVISLYILDNINANFIQSDPEFSDMPTLNIYSFNSGTNGCFYLLGVLNPTPYVGTYDYLDWNTPGDKGFNIQECADIPSPNNIIFNLNTLGSIGEYIDINFSGDFDDSNGVSHTISGVIHVIRDN